LLPNSTVSIRTKNNIEYSGFQPSVGVSFLSHVRFSGKRRSTSSNSSSPFTRLLTLKELLGIFEIMGATSRRNSGANLTWLETKLHPCLKSRILSVLYCSTLSLWSGWKNSPTHKSPMQSRSSCDLLCVGRKLLRQSTTTVCALDVAYWALFEVDSF